MANHTYIYCKAISDIKFPREHVIPEAFGKFKNNLPIFCGQRLMARKVRDRGETSAMVDYEAEFWQMAAAFPSRGFGFMLYSSALGDHGLGMQTWL